MIPAKSTGSPFSSRSKCPRQRSQIHSCLLYTSPGHTVLFDADGLRDREYFHLEARPHLEEYEETARTLQDLLTEAVACRLDDGGPLCAFLEESPGSELAAAIAAKELGRRGRQPVSYTHLDVYKRQELFNSLIWVDKLIYKPYNSDNIQQ